MALLLNIGLLLLNPFCPFQESGDGKCQCPAGFRGDGVKKCEGVVFTNISCLSITVSSRTHRRATYHYIKKKKKESNERLIQALKGLQASLAEEY